MKLTEAFVSEAAYTGNIGIMELSQFMQKATDAQKKTLNDLIAQKRSKEVWQLVFDVTGMKLK